MRIPRLTLSVVAISVLISPTLLSAQAQTDQVEAAAFINLVPGHPFTAEYVTTFTSLDDGGKPVTMKSTEHVARDRMGRVWRFTEQDDTGVETYTIEDPVAHQQVRLLTGSDTFEVVDPSTNERKTTTRILNHGAIVTPYPRTIRDGIVVAWSKPYSPWPPDPPSLDFAGTHGKNLPGIEDAGWITVDGLSLHGYRTASVLEGKDQGRAQVNLVERLKDIYVCRYRTEPDDLHADRYTLGANRFSSREVRVVLRNIKLVDPDPSLFKIPAEYKVETQDEFDDELQRLETASEASANAKTLSPPSN